ncbi:MAG: acyl--CoA ligase [Fimbriimonadaceae bacterium]|nr:acyl--CoA ligase [Alphaproteobacteria bacterium]
MPKSPVTSTDRFSGPMPPRMFNMARYCLETSAKNTPDKMALTVFEGPSLDKPGRVWTYLELENNVRRITGSLHALGLEPGDRILIRLDNCAEYAFLFFAAIAGGYVPIPASTQLTGAEIAFFLEDSGAALIAISPQHAPPDIAGHIMQIDRADVRRMAETGPLVPYAETAADDPAYLIYTSGTSSHPKGVLHAHRAAWGRRPMIRDWYDLQPDDIVLHAGAFNWTYTLGVGLTDPWAQGATAVVYTGEKNIQVWPQIISVAKATIFAAVPTIYRQILKYCTLDEGTLQTLRHGLTAGESLPVTLAEDWRQKTGRHLFEAFGMSEISTYISSSPSRAARPGSPGRAQTGRSVAILPIEGSAIPLLAGQSGVIAVHRTDPGLMLGYWNRPQEEAEVFRGDWFLTGDIAHRDEDGYFWLHGRADNMMNAMGYRVSPVEVEAVLNAIPGIAEAAVVECEARENIHIICAFVVLEETEQPKPQAEDIIAQAAKYLATYKVPRQVVFIDALPRTPNGKIKHMDLKSLYRQQDS